MIFIGYFYDKSKRQEILKKAPHGVHDSGNNLAWSLIDGFIENGERLKIYNFLPVGCWPLNYKKINLKTYDWEYLGNKCTEIGGVNLPLLKQLTRQRKLYNFLKKEKYGQEVFLETLNVDILKCLKKLKHKNFKITLLVTDIPEYFDLGNNGLISKLRNKKACEVYKHLSVVDRFVLLTKQMKNKLNFGDKPYVVIEGICAKEQCEFNLKKSRKKTILYTGLLHKRFGIDNLLEVFKQIKDKNYELWLCGNGDMHDKIVEMSKNDSRIKFYGFIPREKILELQAKATVLVNPRQNIGEYTKYSFPSKTMEYMASGTPVIMYKLDGVPDEYDKYLYYVDDNSVETLTNKIVEVCSQSDEERKRFGERARKFILENKNYIKQTKKILDFISKD